MIHRMIENPTVAPAPATNPFEEYYADTGIRLSYIFNGNSAVEQVEGNITLTSVGGALVNQLVVDTLDEPGKAWSHAYAMDAGGESWDSDGTIDFGDSNLLLHVTGYGAWPGAGIVDIAGNEDATSGVTIQTNSGGDLLAFARFGATTGLTIMGSFAPSTWWEACMIIERPPGQAGAMRFATIDQELTTGPIDISAGSLNSSRPFSIGSGRVTSFLGQVMSARIAFGEQLSGVSPKSICQSTAKRIWWDNQFTRVSSAAK